MCCLCLFVCVCFRLLTNQQTNKPAIWWFQFIACAEAKKSQNVLRGVTFSVPPCRAFSQFEFVLAHAMWWVCFLYFPAICYVMWPYCIFPLTHMPCACLCVCMFVCSFVVLKHTTVCLFVLFVCLFVCFSTQAGIQPHSICYVFVSSVCLCICLFVCLFVCLLQNTIVQFPLTSDCKCVYITFDVFSFPTGYPEYIVSVRVVLPHSRQTGLRQWPL